MAKKNRSRCCTPCKITVGNGQKGKAYPMPARGHQGTKTQGNRVD